ncbi:MAG: aldolase [Propioniciclava sp.]
MSVEQLSIDQIRELRMADPGAIRERLQRRRPFPGLGSQRRVLMIALDHPARGSLRAGSDSEAMADRIDLLRRTAIALQRPGVDGFLGTADLVEDLTLMGVLEAKWVLGSMNRGGLVGASFELDDRFTGYDASGIVQSGLDGGKMLVRIDLDDPASVRTLEACARAVDELAARGLWAMVEPFWSRRVAGVLSNDLSPEAVIRSITVASGLGRTSARTLLKLPATADMARVAAATTLPVLILGGEVPEDPAAAESRWAEALAQPNVYGLVMGRSLLYPADGDVAGAVDRAVGLL